MTLPGKTILPVLLLWLSIFAAPSCLSVGQRMYNVPRIEKKTRPENIAISYERPEKKHLIIGELVVRYNSEYRRELALKLMKEKAAEYGADGIILQSIERADDNWSMSHHQGDTPVQFQVKIYNLKGSMYQFQPE